MFVVVVVDDGVVLGSGLGFELWYSFLRPRRSFQRLEHLGALGEKRYGSVLEISGLRRVFGDSGDLIPEMVASLT